MTSTTLAAQAAQAQLDAYNARDIDAFVACYTQDVQIFDLKTNALLGQGADQLRQDYDALFKGYPELHAALTHRSVIGNMAFDHEHVTGRGAKAIEAMAIYEVNDEGLIARVWFVRA